MGSQPQPFTLAWDLYLCALSDLDADGFVQLQPDSYGGQGGDPIEAGCPAGFYARPLDPDTDDDGEILAGCPMLVVSEGGKRITIPLTDKRSVAKLPSLKKGESIQYGPAANGVRCHEDGTISISTTDDGTPSGQTIYLRVGPKGHYSVGPWGTEKFDANGWHLFTASGVRIDAGGISGFPGPFSGLGAYLRFTAPILRLVGSLIAIGPAGGVSDAVAKAGPAIAALNAIAAALQAAAVPGAFVSAAPGSPVVLTPPLLAALATAISAVATAAAPGPTGISSSSATVV